MDLKRFIPNAVTLKAGRSLLVLGKNSPHLMFGAGVICVVGAVVVAARGTLRLEEVLEEGQAKINDAKALAADKDYPTYDENDCKSDIRLIRARTAGNVAKLYVPAASLVVLGIGALTGSHVVLTRRNLSLTAAYAAIDKGFKEYRERVVSELGSDKDQEYRYGMVDQQVDVKTEKGTKKTIEKAIPKGTNRSVYARVFDEVNSTSWSREPLRNQVTVQCVQNYANQLLRQRGHVTLNDVHDMLGMSRTREGYVVGWILDEKSVNPVGDNYIDFGVFEGDAWAGKAFVEGHEASVWLDFNVDGIIYDRL